jgi:hypothetical protein
VIHTPAGVPTHEPEPPGERLDELRVATAARLQLRHLSTNHQPSLDALAQNALERVAERVNGQATARCSAISGRSRRIPGS